MHTFLKKAASLILCLAFLGNFPSALAAEPAAVPQTAVVSSAWQFRSSGRADLAKLSQQEITQLLSQAPGHYDGPLFDQTPSCQAPYSAGMVTGAALQAATARLNALRRIAGLSAVTLDAGLCSSAQYGAVIQAARGSLSHTPAAPGSYDFISWPGLRQFPYSADAAAYCLEHQPEPRTLSNALRRCADYHYPGSRQENLGAVHRMQGRTLFRHPLRLRSGFLHLLSPGRRLHGSGHLYRPGLRLENHRRPDRNGFFLPGNPL